MQRLQSFSTDSSRSKRLLWFRNGVEWVTVYFDLWPWDVLERRSVCA